MIGRNWWARHKEVFVLWLVGFGTTCLIQLAWLF